MGVFSLFDFLNLFKIKIYVDKIFGIILQIRIDNIFRIYHTLSSYNTRGRKMNLPNIRLEIEKCLPVYDSKGYKWVFRFSSYDSISMFTSDQMYCIIFYVLVHFELECCAIYIIYFYNILIGCLLSICRGVQYFNNCLIF